MPYTGGPLLSLCEFGNYGEYCVKGISNKDFTPKFTLCMDFEIVI